MESARARSTDLPAPPAIHLRIARRHVLIGVLAATGGTVAVLALQAGGWPWFLWDLHTYWEAARSADPYAQATVGAPGAYLYSPSFLLALQPLASLPWLAFAWTWTAVGVALAFALASMARGAWRPLWLLAALLALVDVWAGNVNLLIAGALVIGFRWPAAWSFVVLTKVTPGLGLAWFAMRREWRSLGVALAATALIAGVAALLAPDLWSQWLAVLTQDAGTEHLSGDMPVPAWFRFPLAIALIVWAAPRNQRWALPVACLLLLPVIWPNGYAILVGAAALAARDLPDAWTRRLRRSVGRPTEAAA